MGSHSADGPPIVLKMKRERPVIRHANRNKLGKGSRLMTDVEEDPTPVFVPARYTGRHRRSRG